MEPELIFLILLTSIVSLKTAWSQEEKEPPPKVIKVSLDNFEKAVIKSLIQNKAELHSIVACEDRCGLDPNDEMKLLGASPEVSWAPGELTSSSA